MNSMSSLVEIVLKFPKFCLHFQFSKKFGKLFFLYEMILSVKGPACGATVQCTVIWRDFWKTWHDLKLQPASSVLSLVKIQLTNPSKSKTASSWMLEFALRSLFEMLIIILKAHQCVFVNGYSGCLILKQVFWRELQWWKFLFEQGSFIYRTHANKVTLD